MLPINCKSFMLEKVRTKIKKISFFISNFDLEKCKIKK